MKQASPPVLHINMNSSNYNESQGLSQQDYDIQIKQASQAGYNIVC